MKDAWLKNFAIIVLIQVTFYGCASTVRHPVRDDLKSKGLQEQNVYSPVLKAHYLSFSGQVEEGIEVFKKSLSDYPDNGALHFQYAKFLLDLTYRTQDRALKLETLNEARSTLLKATELLQNNYEAMKLLADVQIELGQFMDAVGIMEDLVEIKPEDQKILIDLARLYVHIRLPEKAVDFLKSHVENSEALNLDMLKVYALACGESGMFDEAISAYETYLGVYPDEFEASFNLALCLFRSGQLFRAATVLESLIQSGRVSAELAELYVDVLKSMERYDEAIQVLLDLRKNPQFEIAANIEIGQIYLLKGEPQKAHDFFIQAVSRAPNDRRATFYAAVALSELGQLHDALLMLENNLEDKPVSIAAADLASDLLIQIGRTDLALAICNRLSAERENDSRTYLIVSTVFEKAKMESEAMDALQNGVKRFPDHLSLNLKLAYKLEASGQWVDAIQIAEGLMLGRPDDPEIANFIGYVLADNNMDLPRALQLIQQAVTTDPENPAYLDSLAWVYYRMERYSEALDLILKAVDLLPEDPIIVEHQIYILLALKRYDKARAICAEVEKRFQDSDAIGTCRELLESGSDE